MPSFNFGDLLESLSGVLEDAGFVVTPDQIVRAHAVLLRLGTERSPSGLVTILSPIFSTSDAQQEQFTSLFIRALDLCNFAAGEDAEDNPYVIGRAKKTKSRDPAEVDRERRLADAELRAERPRNLRAIAGAALAAVLLLVLALVVFEKLEPQPKGPIPGTSALNLPNQKEKVPKSLPLIDGRSTLDIQLDSSGHDSITESLMTASPALGIAVVLMAMAALGGLELRRRRTASKAPIRPKHTVSPPLPKVLRYGNRSAVAAANRLMIPAEDRLGSDIDVSASIQEYIRAGYWKGLMRARPTHPQYVALTRNPNPSDPRSLVSDSLIQELESLGVSIDTFYFGEDPRDCVSRDTGRRLSVQDLARERGDDRLLLFSDGSEFLDPVSGRPHSWIELFRNWKWRELALPASGSLTRLPARIHRLFGRTTSTMQGLANTDSPTLSGGQLSVEGSPDWMEDVPVKTLADRLETWLGPGAFQWFATCAIYSEFNGAMLLYLGEMPELGELNEDDLERMLTLPYVVDGSIPEPLRLELLDRLNSKVAQAARLRVVELLTNHQPHNSDSSEAFKVEYAAQRWLATRTPEDQANLASAMRQSSSDTMGTESALYALTRGVLPYWTLRRKKQFAAWLGVASVAAVGFMPFVPIVPGRSNAPHVASKPLGTNFGDWICFTKIEQVIHWQLPPDTEIKKLAIVGYDQSAVGEGFQLVSRAQPGMTIGPIDHIEGPQAGDASVVFEPLHAKEYTGQLSIETNRGRVLFGLRGTGVYGGDGCVDEGHGEFGLESDFNGNGCNQITEKKGAVTALLAPARPNGPSDTHSALVLGPWRQGDFDLTCGVRTIAQLRDPAPFGWEVGWIIWNFVDLKHFYYLALKGNGWELGRKDNLNPTGQQFLATKDYPVFPPGRRYFVHISRVGDNLTVDVDGKRLTSITDTDHPVTSGRIGFYSECAASKFDSLEIK